MPSFYRISLIVLFLLGLWMFHPAQAHSATASGTPESGKTESEASIKAQSATQAPDTIRILNYNIRFGLGMDNVLDLRRVADLMRTTRADLVALQEVDVGVRRSFEFDLMQVFAGYTGMEPVFYKNIPHDGGEYGNGILSRFPVVSSRNHHIVVEGGGEQRGLLQTEIQIGDVKLAFMNTHLDHRQPDGQRLAGVQQIIETKRAYRGMPVIITGDFNDLPGSRMHENMKEYFTDVWEVLGEGDGFTFRSDRPERRIDYVFYTNNLVTPGGPTVRPISIEVLDTQASDHLPILVVFVIDR